MGCQEIKTEGGPMIVCTRGARRPRCHVCRAPAEYLCDGAVETRKSGTCDRPICWRHGHHIDAETDSCTECFERAGAPAPR